MSWKLLKKELSKKIKYVRITSDNVIFWKNKGVSYLENKQVATVRTITGELIGGFILYGIVFGILYSIIYAVITNIFSEASLILTAIIAIVLQAIAVFCIWRCSIATTFRKRSIETNDVKIVMKNLMIFTVIICFITAIANFMRVNDAVEELINSDTELMVAEAYMEYLYDDEEIAQYKAEKENIINETKTELYTYLIVLEIGLLVVYLGVVPLQKKAIMKYAV